MKTTCSYSKKLCPLKNAPLGKQFGVCLGGLFTQEVPTTNSSFFNLLCKDIIILKRVCCMCKSSMRVFLISSTHTTVTAGSFTLGIKASCTLHETTIQQQQCGLFQLQLFVTDHWISHCETIKTKRANFSSKLNNWLWLAGSRLSSRVQCIIFVPFLIQQYQEVTLSSIDHNTNLNFVLIARDSDQFRQFPRFP